MLIELPQSVQLASEQQASLQTAWMISKGQSFGRPSLDAIGDTSMSVGKIAYSQAEHKFWTILLALGECFKKAQMSSTGLLLLAYLNMPVVVHNSPGYARERLLNRTPRDVPTFVGRQNCMYMHTTLRLLSQKLLSSSTICISR